MWFVSKVDHTVSKLAFIVEDTLGCCEKEFNCSRCCHEVPKNALFFPGIAKFTSHCSRCTFYGTLRSIGGV